MSICSRQFLTPRPAGAGWLQGLLQDFVGGQKWLTATRGAERREARRGQEARDECSYTLCLCKAAYT
jgi:hypothetical protein